MATTNKYDRQLRLWGPEGQKALSESCIVLFHASSTGTESLKNLVLPGIGSFHIVDEDDVTDDNGNGNGDAPSPPSSSSSSEPFSNFFVFPEPTEKDGDATMTTAKSKSRAEIAARNLSELNSDVIGGHTTLPSLSDLFLPPPAPSGTQPSPSEAIYRLLDSIRTEHNAEWSNLVLLAADLPPTYLRPLADFCGEGRGDCPSLPLVIARQYGLLGTVRVQASPRPIVDSRPESSAPDLRIAGGGLEGGFRS